MTVVNRVVIVPIPLLQLRAVNHSGYAQEDSEASAALYRIVHLRIMLQSLFFKKLFYRVLIPISVPIESIHIVDSF